MSFIIQAPFPAITVSSYLPNPQLGDSVGFTGQVEFKRSMDGTKYLYVKSRENRQKLIWNFTLSQMKYLELREVFDVYSSQQFKVTDHNDDVYTGYFTNNPFEFESVRKGAFSPGNNTICQIQLEFEGFKV